MMLTAFVIVGTAIVCYGLLHTLQPHQQGVLYAVAMILYMVWRYPRHEAAPVAEVVQASPAPKPAPSFVAANAPVGAQARTVAVAQGQPTRQTQTSNATPEQITLSTYQFEAAYINQQLVKVHKLNCSINLSRRKSIFLAHDFVGYVLDPTGPLRFEDLQRIEDSLAREINAHCRRHQHGDVNVIAVNSQPIVLQVNRIKPRRLSWSERRWNGKPMQALLGHYWHGAHCMDLVLSMAGKDTEYINGAFFGQPGSGKSTALHIALIGLLESTPSEMLEVYAIDLKANAFACYRGLPHVRRNASTIDGAIDVLEMFAKWCTAEGQPADGKYRLLVIDECQLLTTHLEHGDYALSLLSKILEAGREPGIRVLTTTQNPDAFSYPSRLKPKTHYMAAGLIKNDDYLRRQMKIYGASKLQGKGEMIFSGPFGDYRLKVFWLTDEDRARAIAGLARRWGRYASDMTRYQVDTRSIPVDTQPDTGRYEPDISPDMATATRVQNLFPIRGARPLTEVEADAVRQMATLAYYLHNGTVSMSRLVPAVYGSRNPERTEWVRQALNGE